MKAQSAIEYLMTYGWMLLVVAVVGGAIFSMTDMSTESVSGFQGQDVIVENFGMNSYGGLELLLLKADPQVDNISNLSVDGTEIPVNVDFSSGNNDDVLYPYVADVSGTDNLDLNLVYNQESLKDVVSSGSLTGGYEIDVPENLAGFWPLKEDFTDDSETFDISDNSNHADRPPSLEIVNQGRGGLRFSEDPVNISHDSDYNFDGEFTVSMHTKSIVADMQRGPENLKEVSSCTELQNMDPSSNHYQSSDIDCSGIDFTPVGWGTGSSSFDGEEFTGYFDGRGHTISNVSIGPTGGDYYAAMFPIVGTEGELIDFTLEDSDSTGTNPSGLISARNKGLIRDVTIIDSRHYGANYQAGIVAGDNYGIIRNVGVRESTVEAGNNFVGGITGNMPQGSVERSYFIGSIGDTQSPGSDVGGIVGQATGGDIENVYSVANVTGSSENGALVGNLQANLKNAYWDEEKSINSEALGDRNDANYDLKSLTTSQMKDEETLNFFDFETDWKFVAGENQGYPVPRFSEMILFGKGNNIEIQGNSGTSRWRNYVISYNQSKVSYYENGVLQNTESLGSSISNNNQDILIGENARGVISDVMVFDSQLSQEEVQEHYERWSE